jgi:AraC-like DNA-binding protein
LRCCDLEVAEIALACGFSDQSHFTTAFRRLTGIPPHRYRLQISGRPCVPDSSLNSASKTRLEDSPIRISALGKPSPVLAEVPCVE